MRSTRQITVAMFAATLVCGMTPFVLEALDFTFLSMDLGGVGDHFAGYNLDGAILRLDLILVFAGALGLVMALGLRANLRHNPIISFLAITMALSTVVSATQIIDLPAGGMPEYMFRRRVFNAAQLSHLLGGGVILSGAVLVRLRRRFHWWTAIGCLLAVALLALEANHALLRGYEFTLRHMTISHVVLAALYLLSIGLLVPELRKPPLPTYVVALMAGLVLPILAQLSLLFMGETVDMTVFNRTGVMIWCGALIPLLGLCVDLVRGATSRTRESERAYLRHVLDTIPDLVYTRDRHGRYQLLNQAAARFIGGTPEALEGTHILDSAFDKNTGQRALAVDRRILESGRTFRHPGMLVHDAHGQGHWLQWLNTPLNVGDGTPSQVLSVATDISRLKQAEQSVADRLRAEKQLRRSLVRLLRSPATDFPTAMLDVLGELGEAFGADSTFAYQYDIPAGVIRRTEHWSSRNDVAPVTEHPLFVVDWALERLRAGEPVIYSDPDTLPDAPDAIAFMRSLGLTFLLLVPVMNTDGTLWGILGGDFTTVPDDRGRSLRHILTYLADVYAAARHHYLAELELQDATRAAEASARAKGEFLANMSHEIRTPLNAVIGLADILRGLDPSEEQRQYLDMIHHSGDALLGIINDVLDISKIEANQLELDRVPVNLPSLLNEVVDMMAYHAQQQGLELVYHLHPDARLRTQVDPVRLKQVLMNLLNNAIKFTETGHVSLRVRPEARDDGRAWFRFDVSDTGIGISATKLAGIFDKFTQADASHTRKYGGTGLGLAICRSLVELMGGDIAVSSRPDRGTRFTVCLPLTGEVPECAGALPDPALAGQRFVAVMPSAAARENLAVTLGELGMTGTTLPDARQLPFFLDQQPTQLVIADAQMDSVMLEAVCKAVTDSRQSLHRLLLNPLGDHRSRTELADAGWDTALQKPVRRAALRRVLNRLVRPDAPTRDTASQAMETDTILDGTHVLLVEDNLFNQKVAAKLLDGLGCQVTVVENGRLAVDRATGDDFDLILMDCQMPVMDGMEATRLIREFDGPRSQVPIVAMTANVMGEHRRACLAAGMNDFAAKPINKRTLREVMERWAGARTQEPELV